MYGGLLFCRHRLAATFLGRLTIGFAGTVSSPRRLRLGDGVHAAFRCRKRHSATEPVRSSYAENACRAAFWPAAARTRKS
jgi:hypothetical protein